MDNIPYGTRYAYENMGTVFPNAAIRTGNQFPDLILRGEATDTLRTLMIVSPKFTPEPDEMKAIIQFAAAGNQVFISALQIEDTVFAMLHQKQKGHVFYFKDSAETIILDPVKKEWIKYIYPGYDCESHFENVDTTYTIILGKNSEGKANFIRIGYDHGGSIFLHLNPLAFSNFFLLHKKNKSYYDLAFSYLPAQTGVVEWSDYFRYRKGKENFSAMHFILSKRALRWAFWMAILFFILLFGTESKRKQRPISEMPPLRNGSEDFIKTVGQLYFQQKNNLNLATKMIAAFLENIRSMYNLPTSQLNEEFAQKLAFRTGRPFGEVRQMIQSIYDLKLKTALSDQELMDLHQQINQFNKPV